MFGALEIVHGYDVQMLIDTTRVFARAMQVEWTKRSTQINRVAVNFRVGLFEWSEFGEMRAKPVAAKTTQWTFIFARILEKKKF